MSPLTSSRLLRPEPRPISQRGWFVLAGCLLGVLVLGLFIFVNYNSEGGIRVQGGSTGLDQDGIAARIQVTGLDPRTNTATVELVFEASGATDFDENGRALSNVRITVNTPDGSQEIKVPAGSALSRTVTTFAVQGQEADYPFDEYDAWLFVAADNYAKQSDGSLESTKQLQVYLDASGGIDGWNTSADLRTFPSEIGMASLHYDRAFSTRLFALLLLVLMASLSFAAMWVAILVITNRRVAEVALLGWTASMLFALPLLRNSMPNGPPIGASIDILVFFWVLATAIVSALLAVIAYLRQRGAALLDDRVKERDHAS
jgi:hypothetical protein